jgi:ATP-dependent Lon protease
MTRDQDKKETKEAKTPPLTTSKRKKKVRRVRLLSRPIKHAQPETKESDTEEDNEDPASSDVDDRGNIKGLIDYDYESGVSPTIEVRYNKPCVPCVRRSEKKKRRGPYPRKATRKKSNQNLEQDDIITKMLILSDLCTQVENITDSAPRRVNKKRRRRLKTQPVVVPLEEPKSDDEEWEEEEDEEDLRDNFTMEEAQYYKCLSRNEKRSCRHEYETIQDFNQSKVPLKFKILAMKNVSLQSRAFLMSRLTAFNSMETQDNEYHKLSAWFTQFQKLPLNTYAKFPISYPGNTKREIFKFLRNSRAQLDDAVYGHDHVKDEILQLMAGWVTNPQGQGRVLALQGPPGNGKTTLVKNGISKVLGRPFALVGLGGAKDSAFLQGHEYTFEGSKPGRLIEVIRDTGCMNPVVFFDEIDKLSESPAGKEIASLLCHVLDPVQNTCFQDRYFSGIDIDLSKAVFVLSFNDPDKVDPILKDRMRVVKMKGFEITEKIKIAKNYLMKDVCSEFKFKTDNILISDAVMTHIISSYTNEAGVRELRRNIGTIISKLNLIKLLGKRDKKKVNSILTHLPKQTIQWPLHLTCELVDELLKKKNSDQTPLGMYI